MRFLGEIGQDRWACEFFNNKRGGTFIDVGAFDGMDGSNTYYLEKVLGWSGLCIETFLPHYNMAKICRSSIVENVAVYSKDCMLTFQANKHTTRENEPGIPVKATTLTNLFKKHNIPNIIDYISMDIEGSEYDALLGFPWSTHKAIIWTIEHNMCVAKNPTYKNKLKKIMQDNGYIIAVENVGGKNSNWEPMEDWWVHSDYVDMLNEWKTRTTGWLNEKN